MFAASIATLAIAWAGYCLGCLRTREEAYSWREMTDDRRRRILGDFPQRRAKLAIDAQLDQWRR
jgi:predicted Fe-S protein YdhL (DUF1289 family)